MCIRSHAVLSGIETGPTGLHAYFVHSYHLANNIAGRRDRDVTDYSGPVTAIVGYENIVGTQFHPEKESGPRVEAHCQFLAVETVILFPAIDLKDGKCVRLKLGDMDQATIYNDSPARIRRKALSRDQGFKWLHVVDLNGAFEGQSVNGFGSRIDFESDQESSATGRRHSHAWAILKAGSTKALARVILGTVAVRDPALVKEACKLFPRKSGCRH